MQVWGQAWKGLAGDTEGHKPCTDDRTEEMDSGPRMRWGGAPGRPQDSALQVPALGGDPQTFVSFTPAVSPTMSGGTVTLEAIKAIKAALWELLGNALGNIPACGHLTYRARGCIPRPSNTSPALGAFDGC